MSTCVVLFIVAWSVVRLWSVPAAVAMCIVAMMIPPVAAIVANRRGPEDRWFDDPEHKPPADGSEDSAPGGPATSAKPKPTRSAKPSKAAKPSKRRSRPVVGDSGDPESDAWWAELEDRNRGDRRE